MIMFKKIIFFGICIVLSISGIYADGFDLDKYKAEMLLQNPNYRQALLNFELELLTYKTQRRRWLPQSYLSLSPSIGFNESVKTTYTNSLGTTFGFSQKLPFGNSMNGSISQSFSMSGASSWDFNYNPSASLSVQTPFLLATPALFRDVMEWEFKFADISLSIAQLNLTIAQRQNFSESIAALASYMLAVKTTDIANRKYNIMLQRGIEDEQLWTQGRMTTIELSSRDQERYQNYMNLIQKQKALLVTRQKLTLIGLNESYATVDLFKWIENLESCLEETDFTLQDKMLLQKYILIKSWKDLLNSQIYSIPSLSWSLSLSPSSETNGGNNLPDSIENYWMSHINWNWSFSVSMRVSLSPWDSVYKTNETHLLRTQIQQYKINKLQIEEDQELELRQKVIELLEDLRIQNEKSLQIALERIKVSESLYASGRLSEIDLRLQQITVEEAECNLLQTRIDYILAILGFY